ncbi:MAG: dihydrofolate reductase [Bacteroidales bacterium]
MSEQTQYPPITIIVAIAANGAIGINNQLLWHLPEDLKRFKRITTGHAVLMGKNTYLSLPKRPLPNRTNIVISDNPDDHFEGSITVNSVEEAVEKCPHDRESFVIGGGSVYRQFMPIASKLYITKIHQDFKADTFFPEISENQWKCIEESKVYTDENNSLKYSFLTYQKR